MQTDPEKEYDTVAWFRIGIIVTAAVVGIALFVSGARLASYFFLGYALFGISVMLIFKSWRSSSEVDKVRNRYWGRTLRGIPRGILRFLLGFVAFAAVIAVGMIPAFLTSNDFYQEHQRIFDIYIYFVVSISIIVFLWVAGFFRNIRRSLSEIQEIRNAAKKAKDRRAKEKRNRN